MLKSIASKEIPTKPLRSAAEPHPAFEIPPRSESTVPSTLRTITDAVPSPASSKEPLVLIACGSFSPVTFLHLRMFEMARDHANYHGKYAVIGGYLSPVNDAYQKLGLASAYHRVNMCELATEESDWIMVDSWEARNDKGYVTTAKVLDHFERELNVIGGGADVVVEDPKTGETWVEKRKIKIMLLAGSDLILTMSEPGVWAPSDLHHILGKYGCYIIERAESELDKAMFSSSSVHSRSIVALYQENIEIVDQLVRNDISSTKVRMFIRKGMSVEYLIPGQVVKYINRNGLYRTADGRGGSLRDLTEPISGQRDTRRALRPLRDEDMQSRAQSPIGEREGEREKGAGEDERVEDVDMGLGLPVASSSRR